MCLSWFAGERCGRSLTGYVRKGNLSNRRRIGCGVVNHGGEVSAACGVDRLGFDRSSDVVSASCGIAQVHVDTVFEISPTTHDFLTSTLDRARTSFTSREVKRPTKPD